MKAIGAAALTATLLTPWVSSASDAPSWLQQVASQPHSAIEAGAGAVVLVDDVAVTVDDNGRTTTRRLYAVRILTEAGADAASVSEVYTTDSGNVRTMRGWVLADGIVRELGKSATADLALVDNDIYNESRVKVLAAPRSIPRGAVFGAETEVVERSVFTQFEWPLSANWPVRTVRRTLTLPAGWDARAVMFNHPSVTARRTGGSLTWEIQNLVPPPDEPSGPPSAGVVPRLAVTYLPTRAGLPAFDDWSSVSRWLASLADPQAAGHPALSAKVNELTKGTTSEIERIRALARYVQNVQYISIQTGLGRGGGYTPHAAVDVLTKNYGDCKDKANLLRTLLDSLGIHAYLVSAYSGDPDYVRAEWPSPQQFNHAIVAIAVASDTSAAAILEHPSLGRLLFFDPTDEQTPLGELPLTLQGSYGLIVTADGGPLVRMPESGPDANTFTRQVAASLTREGALHATVRVTSIGHPAAIERQRFDNLPKDSYRRLLETDARRQVPGAVLLDGQFDEETANNRVLVTTTVQAAKYAQLVQGRLMIVRPPQMTGIDLPTFSALTRQTPVVLDPIDAHDEIELTLPSGTTVEELPEPRDRETSFGRFTVAWQTESGRVKRTLSLRIQPSHVPADSYGDLRGFLDAFRQAEQTPLVLTLQR